MRARSAQLLLLLVLQWCAIRASLVFDVHRMIQYDRHGQPLGSRRVAVNKLIATTVKAEDSSVPNTDDDADTPTHGDTEADEDADDADNIRRKISTPNNDKKDLKHHLVVVPLEELSPAKLAAIVDRRGASGVLILLRKDLSEVPAAELANWKTLERYCMSRVFDIPVYFAFEDDNEMYKDLKTQGPDADPYRVLLKGKDATALASVSVHNFQGSLSSATVQARTPTLVIMANYDSFGMAPSLAHGVDHNGSGAIAVLELARIFSRLYAEFRTQGTVKLVFVLTGGGRQNFVGANHWLKATDSRALASIDLALCLESIGSGDQLYLHFSRSPKTEETKAVYQSFETAAEELDIPFELMHRKVNLSKPYINWQHELFSKKRILAATLSNKRSPSPLFSAASIFDRRETVDSAILQRNIKFVAQAISKQLFPSVSKLDLVQSSLRVSKANVDGWLNTFSSPRLTPYIDKDTPALQDISKALSKHTSESKTVSFTLDSAYRFYTHSDAQMTAYKVKSMTFQLTLTAAVAAYLSLFYLYCKAPSSWSGWKRLVGLK